MTPKEVLLGERIMITFIKDESGATAIEYGMITGFMTTLIVVAWGGVANSLVDLSMFITDTFSVI